MADQLTDDQRTQLDGIVQQMHTNGESDDFIQHVVNDFKTKSGLVAAPFDVHKQNDIMRANMAKQANAGKPDLLADFATSGPMGDMNTALAAAGRGEYSKAAHNAVVGAGKVLAPTLIPAAVAAPFATAGAVVAGGVGDLAANRTAKAMGATDDQAALAGDVGGAVAGGMGAKAANALPVEPVVRFMGGELARPGGVQGIVGRTMQAGADAADEVAARVRGPITRLFSPGTANQAALDAERDAALTTADTLVKKTVADQHAEAKRTNDRLNADAAAKAAAAKKAAAAPTPNPVLSQVVPLADASAANPNSAAGPRRTPIVSNAGPAALADPRAALMDSIRSKVVPLADDSARSLHTMEAPKTVSRAYAGEGAPGAPAVTLPNIYDGPEAAQDRISHALDAFGDQVRVPADLEVVDNGGQPLMNASGESSASAEALSRQSGMKARGEEFVVKKGNTIRKLVGPDAVDYTPQPGEVFGVRDKDGNFRPLTQGDIKHGLTGNRSAGAMPIAMRRALFNRMTQGTK